MTHRDRQGTVIDLIAWAALWEDPSYRVVAQDTVGGVQVRTVWEGIDDGVVGAMYATGVSRDGGRSWRTVRQDARTEPEALARHREVLAELARE